MLRTGVLALCAVGAFALYADEESVTTFTTSAAMEKAVLDDDATLWMVHFYAGASDPQVEGADTASPGMVAEFAEAASEMAVGLGLRAGAVDVSLEANAKVAKRFGVTRVPTILGFGGAASANPYTNKLDRTPAWFDGASFSKTALKRWAGGKVPGDVVARVDSEKALAKIGGPVGVLLTERSTTSALAKSLGVALRGRLTLVEVLVDADDPSPLAEALASDDEALPKLLAATGVEQDLAVFDGDAKDRAAVLQFLEKFASKEKAAPAAAAEKTATGESWPAGYALKTAASEADFDAMVANAAAAVLAYKSTADASSIVKKVLDFDGSGLVEAVAVDCGALAGHAACGDKDFTAYAAGPSKKALASGSDGAAVLDKAAESLSEERVEFIGSSMDMDAFIRRAIMAGDDETPVGVAVFSNKREISPTVRALGAVLGAHAGVKVCQFANPPAEALEAYGIRKVPAIVAFYPQEREANTPVDQRAIGAAQYSRQRFGPPTFASLYAFSRDVLAQLAPDAATALNDAVLDASNRDASGARSKTSRDPTKPAPKTTGPVFADLNVPGRWFDACGADAATTLCAIAVLDEHGGSTFAADLAVAETVATNEQPSPFAFGWVDGACRPSLAAAFDVFGSSLPTVVAYAPKKGRFAALVGTYAEKDIKSFLRGVMSGRVATAPLRADLDAPSAAVDCAAEHARNVAPVAEEDALEDDFLAELLAEEAAAKKALEAEAAAESKRLKDELKKKKAPPPDGAAAPKKKKKRKKKTKKEL